ncbi:cysteine peptidase family C39 domain-containing protein [Cohaesibacter celericrescens]|uniref:cysteine peptidase family C39 domain-containing protein n=1 Tax=Cohaesibacter celericrescens TaxID=2067669 RepID=UPI0035659F83
MVRSLMVAFGTSKARVVLQMEAAECGASCLAMVLSAYGREITLEEARERCGTSRDGVDIGSIAKAASSYDMDVKVVRSEPQSLTTVPLPAILHWNFDHFVVLEKVIGDKVVLLDPAVGRRVVSADELNRSMTGLVLAVVPGEAFKKGGDRPKILSVLVQRTIGSLDGMAVVFATGILGIVPGLVLSGGVQTFADYVVGQQRSDWLLFILLAIAATVATQAVLAILREWTVAALKSKIGISVAARAFEHALFLPLSFFSQRNPGEIVSRLRIGSEIGGTIAGPLAQVLPNIIITAGYLAVIFLYDWLLGGLVAGIAVANLLLLVWLSKRLTDANRYQNVLEGRASGIATAGFMAFDSFRLMGREDLFASKWICAEEAALDAEQRLGILRNLATLGPSVTTVLISICVLSVGALRVIEGQLDLSSLLALQVLAGLVAAPIAAIASDYCALQEAAGSLMRLDDLMHHPRDPMMKPQDAPLNTEPSEQQSTTPEMAGILQLKDMSFGYSNLPDLFTNVSMTFEPGSLTGVVGPSGAGKSTFARICAGMLTAKSGRVRFEGQPLDQWSQDQLRQKLLYVPQAGAVFSASVRDNLTMWDTRIEDARLEDALDVVGLSETIHFAGGLDRMISSQQPCFSGGEIQRLALARALVRKPAVLVLDEVTSALDALTEKRVLEALRETGAAVLIVTHRIGTSNRCDRQLHLDGQGHITIKTQQEAAALMETKDALSTPANQRDVA